MDLIKNFELFFPSNRHKSDLEKIFSKEASFILISFLSPLCWCWVEWFVASWMEAPPSWDENVFLCLQAQMRVINEISYGYEGVSYATTQLPLLICEKTTTTKVSEMEMKTCKYPHIRKWTGNMSEDDDIWTSFGHD